MKVVSIGALVVLVLLGLATAADRGGDWYAQDKVASSLQDSQDLDEKPDVAIAGFPFLDQYFSRSFDRIEVEAGDVEVAADEFGDGGLVTVSDLDVTLTGVTTDDGFDVIETDRAVAEATIAYDEISDLATVGPFDLDVSYRGEGEILLTATASLLGQSVSTDYTVTPQAVDGAVAFSAPRLEEASDAAEAVADELADVFDKTIPLQGIPFDLRLDDLAAERDGIHLTFSGSDLRYEVGADEG